MWDELQAFRWERTVARRALGYLIATTKPTMNQSRAKLRIKARLNELDRIFAP